MQQRHNQLQSPTQLVDAATCARQLQNSDLAVSEQADILERHLRHAMARHAQRGWSKRRLLRTVLQELYDATSPPQHEQLANTLATMSPVLRQRAHARQATIIDELRRLPPGTTVLIEHQNRLLSVTLRRVKRTRFLATMNDVTYDIPVLLYRGVPGGHQPSDANGQG